MAPRWMSGRRSAWGAFAPEPANDTRMMALGAIAVLLVGAFLGYGLRALAHPATSSSGSSSTKVAPAQQVIDINEDTFLNASRTSDGATQAATAFIAAFPNFSLKAQADRNKLLDDLLAKNIDAQTRQRMGDSLTSLNQIFIGAQPSNQQQALAHMITAPLSYRVEADSDSKPSSAHVRVWFSRVLVDGRTTTSNVTWSTNEFQLVWSDHWRIAQYNANDGPVPQPASDKGQISSFADVAGVFDGFKAYRYAVAPNTNTKN